MTLIERLARGGLCLGRGVTMEGDVAYCSRRAREEREAAMAAGHPKARDAHLELARRFDEVASASTTRDQKLGLEAAG